MIHYWLGLTFLGCWENGCSDEGRRVWNHSVLQMMLIPVPLMGWAVVVERLAFWFQRRRKCKHGVGNWGGKLRSSWNVANAVAFFVVVVFNALSFWGVGRRRGGDDVLKGFFFVLRQWKIQEKIMKWFWGVGDRCVSPTCRNCVQQTARWEGWICGTTSHHCVCTRTHTDKKDGRACRKAAA